MEQLKNIVNYLLLKSHYWVIPGLYHGKMGIIFALYCYAEKHRDECIKDYAFELLQEIYKGLHTFLPIGMEHGLTGIATGITTLWEKNLLEGDLNDVLYDIDEKIMSYDPRRFKDFSFRNGALGVWNYVQERMSLNIPLTSLDSIYCEELSNQIAKQNLIDIKYRKSFLDDIKSPTWNAKDYLNKELGIENGLSYFLIQEAL